MHDPAGRYVVYLGSGYRASQRHGAAGAGSRRVRSPPRSRRFERCSATAVAAAANGSSASRRRPPTSSSSLQSSASSPTRTSRSRSGWSSTAGDRDTRAAGNPRAPRGVGRRARHGAADPARGVRRQRRRGRLRAGRGRFRHRGRDRLDVPRLRRRRAGRCGLRLVHAARPAPLRRRNAAVRAWPRRLPGARRRPGDARRQTAARPCS